MLALEVVVNGQRLAVAGAEDLSVLSCIVNAIGKLGRKSAGTQTCLKGYKLELHLSGLTRRKVEIPNEYFDWIETKKLKVGDEILVRVCRVKLADPPIEASPVDPKRREERKKAEFKWVKSRYLKLRRKYERT